MWVTLLELNTVPHDIDFHSEDLIDEVDELQDRSLTSDGA